MSAPDPRSRAAIGLFWLALGAGIAWLLYLLGPVLTPFLFALILAYIFQKQVAWLSRRGMSRGLAASVVMVLLLVGGVALLLVVVPLIQEQLARLSEGLPRFFEYARVRLEPLARDHLDLDLDFDHLRALAIEQMPSPQRIAAWVLPSLASGGLAVVGFFVNLMLVPLVLFYFMRDWDEIVASIDELVPRHLHAKVAGIAREIDAVLDEFLRGQVSVMVVMALFYAVALWLVGIDYAVAIGLLTGLTVFIPYVGALFGIVLGSVVALMQFEALGPLLWVWAVFGVGQFLEGYVVVPRLVGDRIGLHPVVVIFALLAFGQLFGFLGVLLALPASAALLVWLRHLRAHYLSSAAYRD
jgi:predicted PurR-regulated permease PerM